MNLLVESILSEMLGFSSRCSEIFIGDILGTSSSMSTELHPRCIFHGIEDVFPTLWLSISKKCWEGRFVTCPIKRNAFCYNRAFLVIGQGVFG